MILDLDRGHKPNTRFNADIAFVMEIAWAVAAEAAPFLMQFPRQALYGHRKCRLSGCYGDRPLACFFRRKNEKNGFTIIYMYISI